MPDDECTADEVRDAALRDESQNRRCLPCAPSSAPEEYFAPQTFAESEHLGVFNSVQAASGPGSSLPGLQAPIRSAAAARRTGQWEGTGGWQGALEDESLRFFVRFGSTRVVPAKRRRELIAEHGRGKVHTPRLGVPFKGKHNADGAMARGNARLTAGGLVSTGKIPGTFSANLDGETSR